MPTDNKLEPLSSQQKSRLKSIESYAVLYGSNQFPSSNGRGNKSVCDDQLPAATREDELKRSRDELRLYDLVIINEGTLPEAELQNLFQEKTQVVTYISLGEIEATDKSFDPSKKWIKKKNPDWNSYYVDAGAPEWQDLKLAEARERLSSPNYAGLFFDTVDTVDEYPDTSDGMLQLINRLRDEFPDAIFIQNRGFAVLEQTAPLIDGLLFENLSTLQNYSSFSDDDFQNYVVPLIKKVEKAQSDYNIVALALDYVCPDVAHRADAEKALKRAKTYSFMPFLSVRLLDWIPDYGIQRPYQ